MFLKKIALVLAVLCVSAFLYLQDSAPQNVKTEKLRSTSSPHASLEAKKARAEYWQRMLQDPATGRIPTNVRSLELAHKRKLVAALPPQKRAPHDFEFTEHGPDNVGGRTRAIAIDVTNNNVLLAGGVSGGIWKSTDRGESWQLKSITSEPLTCTAIAQDTRPGQTHIWYYGTGEGEGTATYSSGNGIYKSTDSGETWTQLASTTDDDPTRLTNDFDLIWDMKLNPDTGSLLVAAGGIMRSDDGGETWTKVLGGLHAYTHIDLTSDGTYIAAVSPWGAGEGDPTGLHVSYDDGITWTDITPDALNGWHERGVIACAPSNPNLFYYMVRMGRDDDGNEDLRLFAMERNGDAWTAEDRSAAMAATTGGFTTTLSTQSNYNMALAVKPDNPDFVLYGGTNLFKNENGMTAKSTLPDTGHIGGYSTQGHHPDVHALVFDPADPDILWSGTDGGVSITETVTRGSSVAWSYRNGGYNITQFYQLAVHPDADDPRILAGAQDNGTQHWDTTGGNMAADQVLGGDGAWSAITATHRYQSSQYGSMTRYSYETGRSTGASPNSSGNLFITPFEFDPNDGNICYFLGGNRIYRHTDMEGNTPSSNWQRPDFLHFENDRYVSTVAVTTQAPADRIYFTVYTSNQTQPRMYRLDNASTSESAEDLVEITPPETPTGVWLRRVAINPNDGNEIMVIASNYRVASTFHSNDGGDTWTMVEGNLIGGEDQLGPSIRSVAIQEFEGKTYYWLGTTTGLYLTDRLNGDNTVWTPMAQDTLGNVYIQYITTRPSDDRTFFATYGRGAFSAKPIAGTGSTDIDRTNVPDVRRDGTRVNNNRRGR